MTATRYAVALALVLLVGCSSASARFLQEAPVPPVTKPADQPPGGIGVPANPINQAISDVNRRVQQVSQQVTDAALSNDRVRGAVLNTFYPSTNTVDLANINDIDGVTPQDKVLHVGESGFQGAQGYATNIFGSLFPAAYQTISALPQPTEVMQGVLKSLGSAIGAVRVPDLMDASGRPNFSQLQTYFGQVQDAYNTQLSALEKQLHQGLSSMGTGLTEPLKATCLAVNVVRNSGISASEWLSSALGVDIPAPQTQLFQQACASAIKKGPQGASQQSQLLVEAFDDNLKAANKAVGEFIGKRTDQAINDNLPVWSQIRSALRGGPAQQQRISEATTNALDNALDALDEQNP